MRLAEGETYKEYYVVIQVDGILRNVVTSKGITKLGYTDEGNKRKTELCVYVQHRKENIY